MNDEGAVKILSALAQPTRFKVFKLLIKLGAQGMPAGTIANKLDVTQNTLSSHLNILVNAGVIDFVRDGRTLIYKIKFSNTQSFMDYLVTDCCNGQPELCSFISPKKM